MKSMITTVLSEAINDIEDKKYACAVVWFKKLRTVFKDCEIKWGEQNDKCENWR